MQILREPKRHVIKVPIWYNPMDYVTEVIWWQESPYCMDEGHIVQYKDKKTGKIKDKYKAEYNRIKNKKRITY